MNFTILRKKVSLPNKSTTLQIHLSMGRFHTIYFVNILEQRKFTIFSGVAVQITLFSKDHKAEKKKK